MLVAAVTLASGCAPLSHGIVSLGGADIANPSAVAWIEADLDLDRTVVIQGVDRNLETMPRVASVLRAWTFAIAPGPHLLWLSSAPAGIPWLPQSIECYVAEVRVEAGGHYLLRLEGDPPVPVLARKDTAQIVATGRLVDRAPVMLRRCRFE